MCLGGGSRPGLTTPEGGFARGRTVPRGPRALGEKLRDVVVLNVIRCPMDGADIAETECARPEPIGPVILLTARNPSVVGNNMFMGSANELLEMGRDSEDDLPSANVVASEVRRRG